MYKLDANYIKMPIGVNCIQGQRAVAAIEILNYHETFDDLTFKDRNALYQLLMIYMNSFDAFYKEYTVKDKLCVTYSFSNTLFCIAHEDTEESFGMLLVYVWRIFQIAIAQKILLRGTIVYGDIFVDPRLKMVIGDGIVQATLQYKNSNWFGIDIDDIALHRYHKLLLDHWLSCFYNDLIIPYNIPQTDGTRKLRSAINWRLNLISETGTRLLFEKCRQTLSFQERKKNSLDFAEYIVSKGNAYFISQTDSPTFIRNFYIGKSVPPFKHGDDL